MATSTVSKKALQYLASTNKVAHSLDWRKASGSVLSVQVSKNSIHLAVSSHPSFQEPTLALASIPLKTTTSQNRKVLDPAVSTELSQIVNQFNVCGLVVDWPVQKEGWCGADCGRVLNTLDQLEGVDRPLCLYDSAHTQHPEDSWGRAAVYGKPSTATRFSSKENVAASEKPITAVWADFCRDHWPDHSEAATAAKAPTTQPARATASNLVKDFTASRRRKTMLVSSSS